jgi:hypothetical protein
VRYHVEDVTLGRGDIRAVSLVSCERMSYMTPQECSYVMYLGFFLEDVHGLESWSLVVIEYYF